MPIGHLLENGFDQANIYGSMESKVNIVIRLQVYRFLWVEYARLAAINAVISMILGGKEAVA